MQDKGDQTVPVSNESSIQVPVYTKSALSMVIQSGEKKDFKPVLILYKSKVDSSGKLIAPIKKGEKIGYLSFVSKSGQSISYLTPQGQKNAKVDVVAAQYDNKANWFIMMMRGIDGFFSKT